MATSHDQPPPGQRRRRWWRGGSARQQRHAGTRADARASEQERIILEALADIRDMEIREVMTPRVDVVCLTVPVHAEDVARAARESGHSCFPVVHDDLDDVVGLLFVNDLFSSNLAQRPGNEPSPIEISRRLRQPYLLPESMHILDALVDMRRQKRAFAFVLDEYGGVGGVLTVKDLLEPLVGDLHDEFDRAQDEPAIVRVDATRWLVDGRESVDDVRDRLGIEIPDGEYVTLGGFLFDGFGHIPDEGESLTVGEWQLIVQEMDKRRVAKVVARRLSTSVGSHPSGAASSSPVEGVPQNGAAGPADRPAGTNGAPAPAESRPATGS